MALRLTRRARPAAHEAHGAIARVARWLADVPRDCRLAQRQMRRLPGVTALVVLTLALGIGANVTLVGAVEHLLLRPPDHVREPARVVRLLAVSRDGQNATTVVGANYPTLLDLQRASTAFESVAGFATRRLSLGTGTEAVEVRATLVSSDFFAVLAAILRRRLLGLGPRRPHRRRRLHGGRCDAGRVSGRRGYGAGRLAADHR